ncbi:MAG: sulfur carrier protein ThiS adenylyltransferase ThiF [Desulfitobacteriaceae bacterium]
MNPLLEGLQKMLGEEKLDRIAHTKVGIAGLGGLGSNVAYHLVRSGFTRFVLADFDQVEASNLNRQFFFPDQIGFLKTEALAQNLLRLNPELDLALQAEQVNVGNIERIFGECDIWVEAFDKPAAKKMFVESALKLGKKIVSASGLAGWDNADALTTTFLRSDWAVVGDHSTAVGAENPPLSPRVGVAAAKEADIVLTWTLGGSLLSSKPPQNSAKRKLPPGLYALTSTPHSLGRSNIEVAEEILQAGVKILQYREKSKKQKEMYQECLVLRQMTRDYGALLIINDHIEIALAIRADGVHIGQDDLPIQLVRNIVGPSLIIGVSTHSPEQAQAAIAGGADYIGVGPIYATRTKTDVCDPVGLDYLRYAVENATIPFVVIGGIKEHNLPEVVKAGATTIALVTEIVGSPDIGKKIRELQTVITENTI